MTPLRLGFIGLGHIARTAHLPGLAPLLAAGEARLQALCDPDPAALSQIAAEYGVAATYTDHHEMLEREELDALYLLIPPTLHTDVELLAAERGIALFVEKPQTLDMEQARRFDGAIQRAGIVCQVGFMSRYYPTAERLRDLLAERRPRHANVQLFYSGAPIRYWTSRWELCGGSFVENTIHTVDLLRYFHGDIAHTSAFYVNRDPDEEAAGPMNLPHAYLVNYRFANGIAANCTTSRCLTGVNVNRRDVAIVSDSSLIEWSAARIVENGETVWEDPNRSNPFALQAAAFLSAVRQRDPNAVRSPYREALNSLEAVLAANESALRGGELVHLNCPASGQAPA